MKTQQIHDVHHGPVDAEAYVIQFWGSESDNFPHWTWEAVDANILEVLAWAGDKAGDRSVTVSVVAGADEGGKHLIKLLGDGPTRHGETPPEAFKESVARTLLSWPKGPRTTD